MAAQPNCAEKQPPTPPVTSSPCASLGTELPAQTRRKEEQNCWSSLGHHAACCPVTQQVTANRPVCGTATREARAESTGSVIQHTAVCLGMRSCDAPPNQKAATDHNTPF